MSKFLNISTDNTLGGNTASDNTVASQKAVKDYLDNSIPTVDQTYDSISTNAQSGTAVAQAIAGFSGANTDLSNLTSTGKSTGAGLAMPSLTYDDLTLGASGATYTAPANGYFTFVAATGGTSDYAIFYNVDTVLAIKSSSVGNGSVYCCLPAEKGASVYLFYSYQSLSSVTFRFIYAKGEN